MKQIQFKIWILQDACFGDKLSNYQKRFGGYWRFQDLKDFCYLENPKFPPKEMIEKINSFSKDLITKYPSNKEIQSLTATSVFDVKQEEIVVGNGSAELIKELGKILSGKLTLNIPVFNEYISCFNEKNIIKKNIIKNNTEENDYLYNKETIIKNMKNTKIIALINPDNPSGNFIEYNDMLEILEKAKEKSIKVIFDESFIDFTDKERRYTLIKHSILEKYPNLIVIKSISKSYGVPGLRLGVLASGNKEIVQKIKENLEIQNVNSFAEYFMQILYLYKKQYEEACDYIAEQRNNMHNELENINFLKVYKSQANYLMCKLLKYNSKELAEYLLNNYNILIKNLKDKEGFKNKNYIRIAIKSEEDNCELLKGLREFENYKKKREEENE